MNNVDLKHKVNAIAFEILKEKGVIAPVDVLMGVGILSKKDYEDWRMGRIPYLEKVCHTNLSKLSTIMKELRAFGAKNNLKMSWTSYKKWGKGKKIDLRFSKSNDAYIEKAYATHMVGITKKNEKSETTENIELTMEGNEVD